MTVNQQQQFPGGYLSPELLSWTPSGVPQQDGQWLFDQLFSDDSLRQTWAEIRGQARGQKAKRRIRLRITESAPEVHRIPWELLQDLAPNQPPQHLTIDAETPFSRYIASQLPPKTAINERPLKLLVAIANPDNLADYENLTPIDFQIEQNNIEKALSVLSSNELTIKFIAEPVTLAGLEEELRAAYHFLHIIAHGKLSKRRKTVALFFSNDHNRVKLVSGQRLVNMINRLEHKPWQIFLASCQTAMSSPASAFLGLAPALIQAGVPAVVAMQDNISVNTTRTFTQVFYRQLSAHGLVDLASNEARATLVTSELREHQIPVLFSRLADNRLIDISASIEPVSAISTTPALPFEPETILIKAGPFLMGDKDALAPWQQHEVNVAAYKIGKFPVTNAEYAKFVEENPAYLPEMRKVWRSARPPERSLKHPVIRVSWYDALAYCEWLSQVTGRRYRLPTEAEWEKAARGPADGRRYPWGDDLVPDHCNYNSNQLTSADQYPKGQSPYGCFDMVGNIWEWTSTLWGAPINQAEFTYPYKQDEREQLGAPRTKHRIYRGGSHYTKEGQLGCSERAYYIAPDVADRTMGFRVALEP